MLAAAGAAQAQDLEPRAYANLPVGQQFFAAGYAYSEGELNPAPGVPITDAEMEVDTFVAAYLRTLDLWGKAGRVSVVVPRTCFKGDAFLNGEFVQGDRCGAADPIINLIYLFYGAPALSLEEFRRTPQHRVIGAGLRVRAPLGDYNNENLINHSANRWEFRPELGISNRWGRWGADAAVSAALFTKNDRFAGRTELEQDPLYQVQAHVIYFLSRGRWLSINGNYFWGGRTERDGVRQDDRQDNSRVGVTLGWPINPHNSLKFYASRGVSTRIGNDFDTLGFLYQYRW
ncbi:MAG: transporter [Halieaceae bacterium]|nr:transporter [Halieaceae bacterium]